MKKSLTANQVGLKYGFKSGLEEKIAAQLKKEGINPNYEKLKLPFLEHRNRTYTPDFPITNNLIIETKGRFVTADRMKMKIIKEQYPNLDIRFIFTNSKTRISKTSKTTYGMWCDKYGFKYADKTIPQEWLDEMKKQK